ncbi:MAG: phosphoribosyltransferase family protein [Pseudomonadales bacterium]|nr:phosphoribosyltransferase family protein [Pseudomonadales bacterium]
MRNKQFLTEQDIMEDSFRLGVRIFNSGFRPTFIVGLWRGGSTVGIYVQECLQTLGVITNHISIRTSYEGLSAYNETVNTPDRQVRVHGTQYLLENLNTIDNLLIVDDVFSTGMNVQAVISRLQSRLKRNTPQALKVAALWYKPASRRTERAPDYFQHETDDWLVLPYELTGLSSSELEQHKPSAFELLRDHVN